MFHLCCVCAHVIHGYILGTDHISQKEGRALVRILLFHSSGEVGSFSWLILFCVFFLLKCEYIQGLHCQDPKRPVHLPVPNATGKKLAF